MIALHLPVNKRLVLRAVVHMHQSRAVKHVQQAPNVLRLLASKHRARLVLVLTPPLMVAHRVTQTPIALASRAKMRLVHQEHAHMI